MIQNIVKTVLFILTIIAVYEALKDTTELTLPQLIKKRKWICPLFLMLLASFLCFIAVSL